MLGEERMLRTHAQYSGTRSVVVYPGGVTYFEGPTIQQRYERVGVIRHTAYAR